HSCGTTSGRVAISYCGITAVQCTAVMLLMPARGASCIARRSRVKRDHLGFGNSRIFLLLGCYGLSEPEASGQTGVAPSLWPYARRGIRQFEVPVPGSANSVSAIQSPDLRANESSTSYTNFISATERACVSRRDRGCGS